MIENAGHQYSLDRRGIFDAGATFEAIDDSNFTTIHVNNFGGYDGVYNWDSTTKRWYASGSTTRYFAKYGSTTANTTIPDNHTGGYDPSGGP